MHDEDDDSNTCQGCGTELPSFLESCPYCDREDEETSKGSDLLSCPECGVKLYSEAQQCFACGAWVTLRLGVSPRRRLLRLLVVVGLVLVLVLLVLLGF